MNSKPRQERISQTARQAPLVGCSRFLVDRAAERLAVLVAGASRSTLDQAANRLARWERYAL